MMKRSVTSNRFVSVWHIVLLSAFLTGCSSLTGTVSTISYTAPPQPSLFFVISKDSMSVTERNITALIEARMIENGYQKAGSLERANVGVVYKYSVDPNGSINSVPDYAAGGHATYTTYPRNFQIALIDLRRSKSPDTVEFFWQGEVYSAGTSRNMGVIAPYFIEVLFENYGKSVSNKVFQKQVE
jgi:hypothetical protein